MVVMSARMNRAWGALHRAFYLSSRGVDAGNHNPRANQIAGYRHAGSTAEIEHMSAR
jgi:hypothetical protein